MKRSSICESGKVVLSRAQYQDGTDLEYCILLRESKFKDEWANWTRVQRRATEYFCIETMPYKEGCCLNVRRESLRDITATEK